MSRRLCCCECFTASDDFDRGDSTNLGPNWVESGNWWISGNQLTELSGSGKAIFQPGKTQYMIVSVWVHGPAEGDVYDLYVQYLDDENYHRVKYSLDAGNVLTFGLYEMIDGAEVLLQECTGTWDASDPIDLTACIGKHAFLGWSGYSSALAITTDFTQIAGIKSGVGHSSGREVTFDDYYYTEHYDSNVKCPDCGFCSCDEDVHKTPTVLQLTYIGYDEGCNDCSGMTGYTIDLPPNNE